MCLIRTGTKLCRTATLQDQDCSKYTHAQRRARRQTDTHRQTDAHTHTELTWHRHTPLQQWSFHSLFAVFIDADEGRMNAAHSGLNTELHNPGLGVLCICSSGPFLQLQRADHRAGRQPVDRQPATDTNL